jgi:phosphoglycolate phosphatase-like HAD superfamily hydrolase
MLRELMRAAGTTADATVMVGDSESDRQAAENAGCRFEWANIFFGA